MFIKQLHQQNEQKISENLCADVRKNFEILKEGRESKSFFQEVYKYVILTIVEFSKIDKCVKKIYLYVIDQ